MLMSNRYIFLYKKNLLLKKTTIVRSIHDCHYLEFVHISFALFKMFASLQS